MGVLQAAEQKRIMLRLFLIFYIHGLGMRQLKPASAKGNGFFEFTIGTKPWNGTVERMIARGIAQLFPEIGADSRKRLVACAAEIAGKATESKREFPVSFILKRNLGSGGSLFFWAGGKKHSGSAVFQLEGKNDPFSGQMPLEGN
jgi:hypothetical protein